MNARSRRAKLLEREEQELPLPLAFQLPARYTPTDPAFRPLASDTEANPAIPARDWKEWSWRWNAMSPPSTVAHLPPAPEAGISSLYEEFHSTSESGLASRPKANGTTGNEFREHLHAFHVDGDGYDPHSPGRVLEPETLRDGYRDQPSPSTPSHSPALTKRSISPETIWPHSPFVGEMEPQPFFLDYSRASTPGQRWRPPSPPPTPPAPAAQAPPAAWPGLSLPARHFRRFQARTRAAPYAHLPLDKRLTDRYRPRTPVSQRTLLIGPLPNDVGVDAVARLVIARVGAIDSISVEEGVFAVVLEEGSAEVARKSLHGLVIDGREKICAVVLPAA